MMVRILMFLFITITFFFKNSLADPFEGYTECGTPDTLGGVASSISIIDTASVIQIFAIFPEDTLNYGSDSLPTGLVEFGDTAGYGPGQIFNKSSFGKFILLLDVNPSLDSNYFILPHSRIWYYTNCDTTESYPEHIKQMNNDVISGLDSLIDFGLWDKDNDGIVDYMAIDYDSVYIPSPYWVGYARLLFPEANYYYTNDTNSIGNTVKVGGSSGHV